MASIFTKIVRGEIPSYKIAEDRDHYAFLDINPNTAGHTLCIPKKEVDKVLDLDEDSYMELMRFSRKVALALQRAVPCKRVGLSVIGLEVPHLHVHLTPLHPMAAAASQKRLALTPDELAQLAAKIRAQLP